MSFPRTGSAVLIPALLLGGCNGGGTTDPSPTPSLIVVGMARLDRSPEQAFSGLVAFFYDPDQRRLLLGAAQINDLPLDRPPFEPGIVPGPIYWNLPEVDPNRAYRMTASVQTSSGVVQVTSHEVVVPASFEIQAPAQHPRGQPLTIQWDPVPNAQAFNIVVVGTVFEAEVPGSATSFTIPAGALANLDSSEIEVTAYNGFYVSLNVGISSLNDAEQAAQRFTQAQNLTGARGSFGASNTAGVVVTFQ